MDLTSRMIMGLLRELRRRANTSGGVASRGVDALTLRVPDQRRFVEAAERVMGRPPIRPRVRPRNRPRRRSGVSETPTSSGWKLQLSRQEKRWG
jgi:hypothetical protein